jgi:hypothetical protein
MILAYCGLNEGIEMLNIITAPENLMFSSALCVMFMLGLIEVLGLGAFGSEVAAPEADTPLFGWFAAGRLPMSIVLMLFLGLFGLGGFALQEAVASWTGGRLSALASSGLTLLLALPTTHGLGAALAKVLPGDETSAVSLDSLVGRRGHIVVGTASPGWPARAKVPDAFGHSHYVLVEPHLAEAALAEGDEILLIGRANGFFLALAVAPHIIFAEGDVA